MNKDYYKTITILKHVKNLQFIKKKKHNDLPKSHVYPNSKAKKPQFQRNKHILKYYELGCSVFLFFVK
jgi:hypothetical protein